MIPTPVPLSAQEKNHLAAFAAKRPDWRVAALDKRWGDEKPGTPKGVYPSLHPYLTGMHAVMKAVVPLAPCKVLDIASPLAQSVALAAVPGIEVTVLDVRENKDAEKLGLTWKTGTATALPFKDASWSVITSLWVMGHVGDGRYGDELDVDGDLKMLSEIARVLKPGGICCLGPGLVDVECGNVFNLHRLYSWEWLEAETKRAGFDMIDREDFAVESDIYIDPTFNGVQTQFAFRRMPGYYGFCVLKKKAKKR